MFIKTTFQDVNHIFQYAKCCLKNSNIPIILFLYLFDVQQLVGYPVTVAYKCLCEFIETVFMTAVNSQSEAVNN